jgi:hypothetical protein
MASSQSAPITVDSNGTVHLGARTIPVPRTVSPEAQRYLATPPWGGGTPPPNVPLWELRATFDSMFKMLTEMARSTYPVEIEEQRIAGVRTDLVSPTMVAQGKQERLPNQSPWRRLCAGLSARAGRGYPDRERN